MPRKTPKAISSATTAPEDMWPEQEQKDLERHVRALIDRNAIPLVNYVLMRVTHQGVNPDAAWDELFVRAFNTAQKRTGGNVRIGS